MWSNATSSGDSVTVSAGRVTTAGGTSTYSDETTGGASCLSTPKRARNLDRFRPDGVAADAILVSVFCDGSFIGNRWVSPADVVDVDAEARRLVDQWVATVPVPDVTIGSAPPGTTITGFETWFWAQGYRGEPITEQLDAFGHPVEVRIEAAEVRWDFGDGRDATSAGFGDAYPARSDVTHVYEVRSTSDDAPDAAYDLTVAFDLVPRYRVDGGPWQQLDPIPVQTTEPLVVREIQAVITHQ
jgi:hypothetical protein